MFVDRLLYPVTTLGPGRRVVVWLAGCTKHCPGCANPELWQVSGTQEMTAQVLARCLGELHWQKGADALTLTGGDPLEQADELLRCLEAVRGQYRDVLLYTGFTLEELGERLSGEQMGALRRLVDVLIDGRYVEALNEDGLALRGSSNQKVNFFNPDMRASYEEYASHGRTVQNVVFEGRAMSVGIHNRVKETGAA